MLVAGGPSFTAADARLIGMARARNQVKVITVNDAVYPCWFADIAWASDDIWWRRHVNLPGFDGQRLGLRYKDGATWRQPSEIDYIEATGVEGYDPNPGYVRHGGNGGYAALHVAAQLGADRIVLVGYDMAGATHWFGDHPDGLRRSLPDKTKWVSRFDTLAGELKGKVEVVNTSMDSALTCFRKVRLDSILKG